MKLFQARVIRTAGRLVAILYFRDFSGDDHLSNAYTVCVSHFANQAPKLRARPVLQSQHNWRHVHRNHTHAANGLTI